MAICRDYLREAIRKKNLMDFFWWGGILGGKARILGGNSQIWGVKKGVTIRILVWGVNPYFSLATQAFTLKEAKQMMRSICIVVAVLVSN